MTAREPVERGSRMLWVSSGDEVGSYEGAGAMGEGSRVIVVGTAPPREKEVRWRRRWPWRDFGSVAR